MYNYYRGARVSFKKEKKIKFKEGIYRGFKYKNKNRELLKPTKGVYRGVKWNRGNDYAKTLWWKKKENDGW